jgi:hypothetical protein
MAVALGKRDEAQQWTERAEALRRRIVETLYVADDAAFYDLDAQSRFVRVRSCVLARVCEEHVVDARMFAAMWERQLGNPAAFWAPYPLPSVALNDPGFVRPIEHNSWGGPSQALTALRAARWMEHYGRAAEFAHMMERWCEALERDGTFRQQVDPLTGAFSAGDLPGYSPAALLMVDFTWRLAGVREEHGQIEWNVRPGCAAANGARFQLKLRSGSVAALRYASGHAELRLDGRRLAEVEGVARIVTDMQGRLRNAVGVDTTPQRVTVRRAGRAAKTFVLAGNARELLQG